jgi:hypothetical protein
MADSDKNILITPATNTTGDPKIQFTGTDATPTTLRVLDDAGLSVESSQGQLFSLTNNLTGQVYSVNDVSGIPLIEASDDGTVGIAPYYGKVLINQPTATTGVTAALYVNGAVRVGGDSGYTLPGADGNSGQVLVSNGSGTLSFADQSGGGGGGDNETSLFYAIAFGQF